MSVTDRLIYRNSDRIRAEHDMAARLFDIIWLWCERSRQRRALQSLDDRLLSDIGIGRAEASEEARKPFWVP